jgi:hypothetical protein
MSGTCPDITHAKSTTVVVDLRVAHPCATEISDSSDISQPLFLQAHAPPGELQ